MRSVDGYSRLQLHLLFRPLAWMAMFSRPILEEFWTVLFQSGCNVLEIPGVQKKISKTVDQMWNGPLVSSSSHDRRDPGILWVLVIESYRYLPASNHGNGYVYERWRHLLLPCLIPWGNTQSSSVSCLTVAGPSENPWALVGTLLSILDRHSATKIEHPSETMVL